MTARENYTQALEMVEAKIAQRAKETRNYKSAGEGYGRIALERDQAKLVGQRVQLEAMIAEIDEAEADADMRAEAVKALAANEYKDLVKGISKINDLKPEAKKESVAA
jgi:hypothetical protein